MSTSLAPIVVLCCFVLCCELLRAYNNFCVDDMFPKDELDLFNDAPILALPSNHVSYKLAYDDSFGFFDYIPDSEWLGKKQLARSVVHQHPNVSIEMGPAIWYQQNYYPFFTCPLHLRRVGGLGDGPKYLCDPHRIPALAREQGRTCLIYSVGSRAKFEFEDGIRDIVGNACEVHIFDPVWFGVPGMEEKNMYFHRWGLKSSYEQNFTVNMAMNDFYTLQEIMMRLNHTGRVIDIFKVDIESGEWHIYRDWLDIDIRHLLVETHSLCRGCTEKSIALFDDIRKAGFVTISREANIHPGASRNGNMGMEWAFLRLSKSFIGV
jgi:hypothetical protein